jgi:PAS domain S-box-containing protein
VLATSSVIWTTDAQGRVTEASESWSNFTGQSFEEFRGSGWLNALHPEDRDHTKAAWEGAVRARRPYDVEYRLRHKDGSWRNVMARGAPVLDENGAIVEWIGNCVDISDRVNVEQALREEVRITDILYSMGIALAAELDLQKLVQRVIDAATSITRARYGAFFYKLTDEKGNRSTHYCLSGEVRDQVAEVPRALSTEAVELEEGMVRVADVTAEGQSGRLQTFRNLLGGKATVRSYLAVPMMSRNMEHIGGLMFGHPDVGTFTARDERIVRGIAAQAAIAIDNARLVQDLRRTKHHLGRQLEYTRNITESVGEGLYAMDRLGRVMFINPAAEKMLGWDSKEMLGRNMHELVHFRHADGTAFPKDECPLMSVLVTGKSVRVDDDVFIRKNGTSFPVAYTSSPTFEGEEVVGAVVAFHDVSQRKWAEEMLRRSNEQLEQLVAERTSELETANVHLVASNRELQDFASVASHDLQEPLRKIQAFGDRLEAKAGERLGVDGQDYLKRMRNAAGRMQVLISDLLRFSRVTTQAQPIAEVDLSQVAAEVLTDIETTIDASGGRVDVGWLPTIDADATQMRQLIQNLIANALKFRDPKITPVVRLEAEIDGGANVCKLLVKDNGIGFDEKYLDRIFNVFQRLHTRGQYEGTGIGLAVCRKIAERHGGSITAQSAPGKGSTFIVTLPLRQPSLEEGNA